MGEKIEALLIDFDGTLVDSVPLLYRAYAHFVMIFGLWPSQEEFITMNGFTADEMVACIKAWRELDYPTERLLKLYTTICRYQYDEAPISDGASEFVQWASGRGYRLGIVTSASREWVKPVLEREKLDRYFEVIIGKENLKRGKPDPEGFIQAVKSLGVPLEAAIAIDDSPNGIEAAVKAKMRAIQFNGIGTYHAQDKRALFFGNWAQIKHFIQEEE